MFKPISQIITKKTGNGLSRSIDAAVVLAKVKQVSAGRFEPIRYRNGRLTIIAHSPVAAQDLVLRKEAIIAQLNSAFGESVVKELYVRS